MSGRCVAWLIAVLLLSSGPAFAQDSGARLEKWRAQFGERFNDAEARAASAETKPGPRPGVLARLRGPVARLARGTANIFDRRFAAGITLSGVETGLAEESVQSVLRGEGTWAPNLDRVDDALIAPQGPEFWAGVGAFTVGHNVVSRGLDVVNGPVQARLAKAGWVRSLSATAFAKQQLALAGAITITRMVALDFGGEWGLPKTVHLAPPPEALELGVTLGSFVVARPVMNRVNTGLQKAWTGTKAVARPVGRALARVGGEFAKALGRRFAKSAAAKAVLAVAPAPGSRVVLAGVMLGDLALAAWDLGGLLFIAGQIEVAAAEARHRMESEEAVASAVEAAKDSLILAQASSVGPERALEDLRRAAAVFQERRQTLYFPAAAQDQEDINRRIRDGGPEAWTFVNDTADWVIGEYGYDVALQAQSVALISGYRSALGASQGKPQSAFDPPRAPKLKGTNAVESAERLERQVERQRRLAKRLAAPIDDVYAEEASFYKSVLASQALGESVRDEATRLLRSTRRNRLLNSRLLAYLQGSSTSLPRVSPEKANAPTPRVESKGLIAQVEGAAPPTTVAAPLR